MSDSADLIFSHFPQLNAIQRKQFLSLKEVYVEWNDKINVISRKDTENFYTRHVLHSLGIAKVMSFLPDADVLDVGTGGGFPGVPLAILFPETRFHLVDSIGKKIKVVEEVCSALDIKNVTAQHERAEKVKGNFDFVVSRAVTEMSAFIPWVRQKFKKNNKHSLANGILYLKGGDLTEEMRATGRNYAEYSLSEHFEDPFFETKKVIYVPFG